ncbi:hypothetical protein EDB87DRAFT_1157591 [Lactarius vividus]|nr:hypothetical protein EDB87DRAFT_1157591 [Lactarius vividus]
MYQAHPEDFNVDVDPGRGDHPYPPQSALTQESRGASNFVDGSGPIFSMYLEMATEEDKKMAEGWAADADGILIFTGLFSAAVASLISVSIQDIRQNPQDTSNFYLSNIYQTLADPNRSDISSSLPSSPPPFSPPNYAVWVNALLFLSLVISISCALLATLLQQWARRYLKVTQPHYSLHKRARIRAFFFEGVDKFLLSWAVEALPALLHVSLFLFFAGISVFLWNVDLTIFKSVVSWIGICTALYGCITLVPIFRHDSPYHTPLSLPAWNIIAGIPFVTFRVLRLFTIISVLFCFPCLYFGPPFLRFAVKARDRFELLAKSYRKSLLQGMQKTVEKTALNSPSEVDTRAFLWTFDSLDEDHELERFFSGLPGFRSSTVVGDPFPGLTEEQKWKLIWAVIGLLDRTFSSDLLPEQVKRRRAVVCAKTINPADISRSLFSLIFKRITLEDHQYGPVQSAEIAHLVRGWGDGVQAPMIIQAIVFAVVAKARRRDDTWFILASNELGIREAVLRDYAARGDSLSLAILIHITRHQFSHLGELSCTSSVLSGIKSSLKRRMAVTGGWQRLSSTRFEQFIPSYIKRPILLQWMNISHPHIHSAMSQAIVWTLQLTFMTTLPLRPLPWMITLRRSLLPLLMLSLPPCPHSPHFILALRMCHHLTTSTSLISPLIRQSSKAPRLSPHRIWPLQVQYRTLPPRVQQCLPDLLYPPRLFPLPPHPLSLPPNMTKTSWRLPMNQTSHPQLLLI